MSKVNIMGLNDIIDPFYRYTMRKVIIEQLRNKTAINNLNDVAMDLDRDPLLILEFLKKRFGVNFIYKNNIATTTKTLSYDDIWNALREFIEFFILCPACNLPETTILVGKNIKLTCKCCSFNGPMKKIGITKPIEKTLEALKKKSVDRVKVKKKKRNNQE